MITQKMKETERRKQGQIDKKKTIDQIMTSEAQLQNNYANKSESRAHNNIHF